MARRLNKAQRLIMIKDALNFGRDANGKLRMERTGDKTKDAQRALELVERETGVSFGEARPVRHRVPGTRNHVAGDSPNATDTTPDTATPQSEIIADLSTYYNTAPDVETGHRISIPLTLRYLILTQDGVKIAEPKEQTITAAYSVSMARPAVEAPLRLPKWAYDLERLSKALRNLETVPPQFPQFSDWTHYRLVKIYVPRAEFCIAPIDPLIRKYRAINEAESEARRILRMADRHSMAVDEAAKPATKPAAIVSRPTSPDSLGFSRPAYRPRAKWFQVTGPVLAMRQGGVR